jgi:hypothetical protein
MTSSRFRLAAVIAAVSFGPLLAGCAPDDGRDATAASPGPAIESSASTVDEPAPQNSTPADSSDDDDPPPMCRDEDVSAVFRAAGEIRPDAEARATLEVTNTSKNPCVVMSFPKLFVFDRADGEAKAKGISDGAGDQPIVTLVTGDHAKAEFRWTPCREGAPNCTAGVKVGTTMDNDQPFPKPTLPVTLQGFPPNTLIAMDSGNAMVRAWQKG